jgi:hypothetical protein
MKLLHCLGRYGIYKSVRQKRIAVCPMFSNMFKIGCKKDFI